MKTIIAFQPVNEAGKTFKKEQVFQKAGRIFDRSLEEFNQGHTYQSLQTAKYALNVARRFNNYCKVNICVFIAQIKRDLGQSKLAEYYSIQAMKYLNREHPDYLEDKKYIENLLDSLSVKKR